MNVMQNITKKRDLPEGLENLSKRGPKKSKYNTAEVIPYAEVNTSVAIALMKYQKIREGLIPGAIAVDTNKRYLVEYYLSDDRIECAVYNPVNGSVMASIYNPIEKIIVPYDMAENDMSLVILSLLEIALSDTEARDAFDNIAFPMIYSKEKDDWKNISEKVAIISDNIISRLKAKKISNNFESISEIAAIQLNTIHSKAYAVDSELYGRVRAFEGEVVKKIKESKPEVFNGKYKFTETQYDEKMVAKINDSYYVPENIEEICKLIKVSTELEPSFRDVLLYGDSGSGKTAGSYAIAAGLGMPYVTYTCHPQTDNFDLIGQFVPATTEGKPISIQEWLVSNDMPTVEDIYSNPKEAYKHLTGKKRVSESEIDPSKVVSELFKKMFEVARTGNGKERDFVFVPSEIIEALKNGYLCEIQEPTVILNEGVLVGLNAILAGGYIRLSNGERVYRHPDSVIVFTTNSSDYAGYGKMSNSVLSRCSLVYKMDTPSIDEMIARAAKKTHYEGNKAIIEKMATCIADIAEKAKDSGIKDGVTGFRELINWISAYRILGDVVKAAYPSVINKSTFDNAFKEEIEDLVINQFD